MTKFPVKKKSSRSPLGAVTPPKAEDIKNNLAEPEHAPAISPVVATKKKKARSNRTVPFTTKITPDFDSDLRQIAFDHKKTLGEILEMAFYEWKKANKL